MNGQLRALLRLFAVQGTWNYERMLGVGMGYAAEPLLEDLKTVDPVRHSEAVVRSAEFFNCHPNLAGLALGAMARAEYDAVPGAADRAAPHRALRPARCAGRPALLGRAGPGAERPRARGGGAGRGLVGDRRLSARLQLVRLGTAVGAQDRARHRDAGRRRDRPILAARWSRGWGRRPGSPSGSPIPLVAAWYLERIGTVGAAGTAGRRGDAASR